MTSHLPARSEDPPHTVMAALTVIIGNAQLLQRRVARGDVVPAEAIIAAMDAIHRAGFQAAKDLREHPQAEPDQVDTES